MKNVLLESLESRRFFSSTPAATGVTPTPVNQTHIAALETGILTPTNFALTVTGPASLRLDWTDTSTSENRFRYESSTSADFGMSRTTATVPANTTTATLSNLIPGVKYYVRVRAENGYDVSDYATLVFDMPATADITAASPYGAPTNVAVTNVTDTTATLSWQDNATAENRYRIMRSTSPDFGRDLWMVTPPANTTSYTLTGLTAGKTYYVRVRAENGPNVSDWGTTVTVTPTLVTPPVAPSGLKVADVFSSAGTLNLSWADNSSNETGFLLERSLTPDFASSTPIQLPANTTSYADTGLSTWTVYYYRVSAVNTAGASAVSNSDWNRTAESEVRSVSTYDPAAADTWTSVADPSADSGAYLSDNNASKGAVSFGFATGPIYANVEIKYHSSADSASNVPITIHYDDSTDTTVYLDERTGGGQWISLGILAPATITIGNDNTDGVVTLDAVRVTEMAQPTIVDFGNTEFGFATNAQKVVTNDPANINGDYVVATPYPDDDSGQAYYYVDAQAATNNGYNGSGQYEVYIRYAQNDDPSVPTGKWVSAGTMTIASWSDTRDLYINVPQNATHFAVDAVLFRFVNSDI